MSDFDDKNTSSRYSDKNGRQTNQNGQPGNGQYSQYSQNAQGYSGQYYQNGQPGNGQYSQYSQNAQGYSGQYYQNGQPGNGQYSQYSQNAQGYNGQYYQNGQPVNGQYSQNAQGYSGQYYQNGQPGGGQYYQNGQPGGGQYYQGGRRPVQQDPQRSSQPVKKKKKKKKWPVILVILLLLALAAGGILLMTMGRISKEKLNNLLVNTGITTSSGYRNIVLYGVDSREGKLTTEAHSDTIIICSINNRTKEVRLASVYRDTYLDNTNGEYRKATECYYFGGPERSINMLNKNLDLNLSDFITVDFAAVIEIVDALGGIDLEITQEEMEYINGYCVENNQVTGVDYTPLSTSGMVHLDGIQALAYCRIRYTDGWDFKRTERQRTVIGLCYQKAKSQGIPALVSVATSIMPSIATSMSTPELISLITAFSSYSIGEETGFPFDQTPAVVDGSDVVVPVNLAANVSQLHNFLFGEENYAASQTVQEISNTIAERSGIYG